MFPSDRVTINPSFGQKQHDKTQPAKTQEVNVEDDLTKDGTKEGHGPLSNEEAMA